MKKFTVGLIAVLVLMLAYPITANAAQPRTLVPNVTLRFDGTTAYCSASVIDSGKELNITMQLWRGNVLVDSWPASGKGMVSVEGNCQVVKGQTYTLVVTGTTNGTSFSSTPLSKTC